MEDLDTLQKDIGASKDIKIEDVNILFLDISSSCTGYAVAKVNFERKAASITKAGCLWLNPDWEHQEKYSYMGEAIRSYFWVVEGIDYIVVEQYSFNKNKMMGVAVVPEMQGSIKAAAWDNGVKVTSILPQSWRSVLKIKPVITGYKNGKAVKDYKQPTKEKVLEFGNVPEEVVSNMSGQTRKTPSDVYDAIAIGIAWLQRFGIRTVHAHEMQFNTHIGVVNQ